MEELKKHQRGQRTIKGVACPVCGRTSAELLEVIYEIPAAGDLLITTLHCEKCGYKTSVVTPFRVAGGQKRVSYKVTSEDDLSVKVVRSPFSTITIPELGVEMAPGPMAEWFVTNIEGVLTRVEDALIRSAVLEDKREAKDALSRIRAARKGKISFTLIIDDPYGLSMIIGGSKGEENVPRGRRKV